MNESDKNRLRNFYRDIRAAALKLFYSMGDGSNVCMSICVKIHDIKDYICYASDLFEVSAVSECSDYLRFYVNLRERVQDLHKHIGYVERKVPVDSVIKKGIESLCEVVFRDEALFGYSEEKAHKKADEKTKHVPGSYFTQYDFTRSVSIKNTNDVNK